MAQVRERGATYSHIHIQVEGKTRGRQGFHTFSHVQVSRHLNALGSTFSIRFPNRWILTRKGDFDFVGGRSCRIFIRDNQIILDGFIEKVSTGVDDQSHTIQVSGRDRTGDLIDCSPANFPQFTNQSLFQIMQTVCKPFGIPVAGSNVDNHVFPQAKLRPGETVFSFLNRLSKQRGLLLCNIPKVGGGIQLCRPGSGSYKTARLDANNILQGTVETDMTQIFSEYNVLSQQTSPVSFLDDDQIGQPETQTSVVGRVEDKTVQRYRPKTLMAEKTSSPAQALSRARWESSRRAAQALRIKVTVSGWLNTDNDIWRENHQVNVDYPPLGVRGRYLIAQVNYVYGAQVSQKTEISLIHKDAYRIEKVVTTEQVSSAINLEWKREDFEKFFKESKIDSKPYLETKNRGAKVD